MVRLAYSRGHGIENTRCGCWETPSGTFVGLITLQRLVEFLCPLGNLEHVRLIKKRGLRDF